MSHEPSPSLVCHLTDKNGRTLSPFSPHAITCRDLTPGKKRPAAGAFPATSCGGQKLFFIAIEGYVAAFAAGQSLSPPIPFCITRPLLLCAPDHAALHFSVTEFRCRAAASCGLEHGVIDEIDFSLEIESVVSACADITLAVPSLDPGSGRAETVCIHTQRVFDSLCFAGKTRFTYCRLLHATVTQYTALAEAEKRHYTNRDALPGYGVPYIFAPTPASYCNLFVNGVLQPQANYAISEGHLTFLTADLPPKGAAVILECITFLPHCESQISASNQYFVATCRAAQRLYTDADALPQYGGHGIPAPCDVSFLNLYVNGILQPTVNYAVEKGMLTLTCTDLPPCGAPLVLEAVSVRDASCRLLHAGLSQYQARCDGKKKCFTDCDELHAYGHGGIPDPARASYQTLSVNAVLQPDSLYTLHKGCLTLHTDEAPTKDAPLILQSVGVLF